MWSADPKQFAAESLMSVGTAARFQCTAEHLIARCDGGTDSRKNIVAACRFCNATRHENRRKPPSPMEYEIHVQKRSKRGKWLPREIHNILD